MRNFASQLLGILDLDFRRRALVLLFLMVLGAGFEALGISMIIPFIQVLGDPSALDEYRFLTEMAALLGVEAGKGMIFVVGVALLSLYVIKNAYLYMMYRVLYGFVYDSQVRLSRKMLEAYLYGPYTALLKRNSSQLLRNITEEVRIVCNNLMIPAFTLFVEGFVVIAIGLTLVAIEPVVAPIAVAVLGLVGATFYWLTRKRMKRLGEQKQMHAAAMIKWVMQGVGGIKESKTLGREEHFVENFDASSELYSVSMRNYRLVQQSPRFFIETVGVGGLIGVAMVLTIQDGDFSKALPVLALFGMAAVRLMPSVTRIVASLTSIRHFEPALKVVHEDIREIESFRFDRLQGANSAIQPRFENALHMRDIHFRYPDADEWTFEGLDVRIPKGASVALVGSSGAGKTTAVDILLGLLKPAKGEILIDDQLLEEHRGWWRRNVGYIAQPTFLMDDTIARNVAFGMADEEIDEVQVWQALEQAQLAEFVRKLPEQLDTMLGERGVRFSGGQRQRIGIARSLYHEPPILVLDEATSALDNQTERQIVEALEVLRGDKTIVTIAHRLSTIRNADILFFLESGRLAASGSFDELLVSCPGFKLMVDSATMEENQHAS